MSIFSRRISYFLLITISKFVKNIYYVITSVCFLLFSVGCMPEYDLPNGDELNKIEPSFLSHKAFVEPKVKGTSKDIILVENSSSMNISMEEKEWEDEVSSLIKTSWTAANNRVVWTTGDRIGIYMRSASGGTNYYDQNNIQYSIASGGSSSGSLTAVSTPIYFPNRTTNTQFFAYYPYSSSAGNSLTINYNLPVNQTSQGGLSGADLMCSNTPTTNGLTPGISLGFSHKMVLLSFKINTSLLSATLTGVTISGLNVTNTGTLNLSTGVVTPNTTTTFSPSVTTSQTVGINTYAYVDIIINPCTISSNADMSKLKVTLSFSGLLSHSTGLVTSGTFVSGTRYVYNLTVLLSL